MERIESQRKKIKAWLEKGNPITPIMALQMFGCFRLSAQIFVLKNEYDMNIKTEMVYEPNGKRYAKYYLVKNEINK
jgi:plasmid maintenance system antidote protein VapI